MAIERVYDVLTAKHLENAPKGEKSLVQKVREHQRKHANDAGRVEYLGGVSQDKNGYYMQAVTKEVDIKPKPEPTT